MTKQGAEIAARITEARTARELSLHALADAAGIPYKTLWRRLNHAPDHFLVEELVAIADATQTSFEFLAVGFEVAVL